MLKETLLFPFLGSISLRAGSSLSHAASGEEQSDPAGRSLVKRCQHQIKDQIATARKSLGIKCDSLLDINLDGFSSAKLYQQRVSRAKGHKGQ